MAKGSLVFFAVFSRTTI